MFVKDVIDVDFVNYKLPSMIIAMPRCSFKCDKLNGQKLCHNSALAGQPDIFVNTDNIIQRYLKSSASAICFQGLEPFDTYDDLRDFINLLRIKYKCDDPVVIYTGYNKDEISDKITELTQYKNIIIKFGRFIPNQKPHYDPVLGVNLISDNQYAEQIS